jgi:nucleoside-diphosphate-sugar epimerase
MKEINKTKPVMVTGATGFVAAWIIEKLLDQGINVHAAVRDPNNSMKLAHLDALAAKSKGTIRYFKSDLLEPGSYKEAMRGCELVFHTASPFTLGGKDPQKELIEPAVLGTENVLQSVTEMETVKRVVLTSSCTAIYTDAIDTQVPGGITEEMWNTTSTLVYQPYAYSKTLAERRAWEMANAQNHWDLVTINPSFVMGPALNPRSTATESYKVLKQMGDGTMKMGAPRMGFGVVDVRDVAEAHFKAGYTPEAEGRYITSGHNSDLFAMAETLLPKYGDKLPLPKKPLPKWLVMLFGPLMDKTVTREFLKKNVDVPWTADNSKIKNELNMSFRPLQETMEDGFQVLLDAGLLRSK